MKLQRKRDGKVFPMHIKGKHGYRERVNLACQLAEHIGKGAGSAHFQNWNYDPYKDAWINHGGFIPVDSEGVESSERIEELGFYFIDEV